ncbi:MAG: hypothetical protein ACLVHY_05495 [Gemmiger sp.]
METLTFKLQEDNFEGPLDLLLYLVGKNKMNLYDINIMELIEYTAAIQTMRADKLEVSANSLICRAPGSDEKRPVVATQP